MKIIEDYEQEIEKLHGDGNAAATLMLTSPGYGKTFVNKRVANKIGLSRHTHFGL